VPAGVDSPAHGAYVLIPHPLEVAHSAILGTMVVLNFHCIGKPSRPLADGEEDVCLDSAQFDEILDAVSGRSDVELTFDDGNSSDVSEALPGLVRHGLEAQFFICPARFGTAGFVDEDDVRALRTAGMSLGSHGMDHVPWRRLERLAIDREIVQAKRLLEYTLQAPVDTASCPFGAYDRRTLKALRAAGFTRVYTSDGGRATVKGWVVARNTVRRRDSAESIVMMLDGLGQNVSLMHRAKRWVKRRR
jgi:peptidoglycan/xylan/chitin deacetylase (PgdA/CDA1 family)